MLGVSDAGVDFIGKALARYKQVREDIVESDPVVTGMVSAAPEVHEENFFDYRPRRGRHFCHRTRNLPLYHESHGGERPLDE